MKRVEIFRDKQTGQLAYRVREGEKETMPEQVSTHTDIRKLRRALRASLGRSVRITGPVATRR
jgi:hypothetical protein